MKKLTLLLAALSVASAAYAKEVMPAAAEVAAPALRVTSIGQFLEIDNNASHADGNIGEAYFGNYVNFAYGDDWTFGATAMRIATLDTDDGYNKATSRIQLDANKSFGDYGLGFRYRAEDNMDRFYLRPSYKYGMFSGSADIWYDFNDGAADGWKVESEIVKANLGPVAVAYYFDYADKVGSTPKKEDYEFNQQLRAYAPVYSNDKLSVNAFTRIGLGNKTESGLKEYDAFDQIRVGVGAEYALTESLSVNGYYLYQVTDLDNDKKVEGKNVRDERYGEFCIGWNYAF